jgi:hypothetical protein
MFQFRVIQSHSTTITFAMSSGLRRSPGLPSPPTMALARSVSIIPKQKTSSINGHGCISLVHTVNYGVDNVDSPGMEFPSE